MKKFTVSKSKLKRLFELEGEHEVTAGSAEFRQELLAAANAGDADSKLSDPNPIVRIERKIDGLIDELASINARIDELSGKRRRKQSVAKSSPRNQRHQ